MTTQQDLTEHADVVAKNWPDAIGQMAAAAIRKEALAQGELATHYSDAAMVIDDTAKEISKHKKEFLLVKDKILGTRYMVGPDDAGFVRTNCPLDITNLVRFVQSATLAKRFTLLTRGVLVKATDRDRAGSIALLAVIGMQVPDTDDGPIDLTDDGIRLQADLNGQDRYGDCTTLATLVGIAHSDPEFIRRRMKWDPKTGTYEVTLYDKGRPVKVNVDPSKLPTEGSQQAATNKNSWVSVYEQAIRQQFGDIQNGQFENVPIERITGQTVQRTAPPSEGDIQDSLNRRPPGVVVVDTAGSQGQPQDVDPAKRVVSNHSYTVRGIDAQGNVILQNPWGPNGGYDGQGQYYPGEVRLTPEEYRRWFAGGAILNPPY